MVYRIGISYTANREVRVASGVAVSRFREKKSEDEQPQTLDISAKVQHPPQKSQTQSKEKVKRSDRPGWGTLGRQDRTFNSGTRHALLQCGAVIDMWYGRNALVLTGTLPGSTNEANEVLARYSAYVVNRLNQYCRRLVPSGLWCFYVWEWQKRGALHIHYCVASDSRAALSRLGAGFRDFWFSVLVDLSKVSGVDLFCRSDGRSWRDKKDKLQADAQFVQKSVAAYFAKYAGKNYHAEVSNKLRAAKLTRYVPSRWAGWSRPVSRAMSMCKWSFEIEGDRRAVERKLNEITGFLSSFAVKRNRWSWNVMPGETSAYYFRTEDLLEVQAFVENIAMSGKNFDGNGQRKEIEAIQRSAADRAGFMAWLKKKKETRANPMWSSLFEAYQQGRCTQKGEEELEGLAREYRCRKRYA